MSSSSLRRVDDFLIMLAYFSIPLQIVIALSKHYPRLGGHLNWQIYILALLFALFIFLCGTGHLLRCMGRGGTLAFDIINGMTAFVSIATAFYLVPSIAFLLDHYNLQVDLEAQAKKKLLEFMNFLCHEIRNPLFAITSTIAFLEASPTSSYRGPAAVAAKATNTNANAQSQQGGLCAGQEDEDDQHYDANQQQDLELESALACIHQSSNLMLRLVNDVLDISKLESGDLELELETVDLNALLQGAIRSINSQMQVAGSVVNLGLTASPQFATPLPLWVETDSVRVLQIAYNLLTNAAKFTPQGSIHVLIDLIPVATALDDGFIKKDPYEYDHNNNDNSGAADDASSCGSTFSGFMLERKSSIRNLFSSKTANSSIRTQYNNKTDDKQQDKEIKNNNKNLEETCHFDDINDDDQDQADHALLRAEEGGHHHGAISGTGTGTGTTLHVHGPRSDSAPLNTSTSKKSKHHNKNNKRRSSINNNSNNNDKPPRRGFRSSWTVLKFQVQDTGPGMTPELLHSIREPYSHAKLSQYRSKGGTGLGLTILDRLTFNMGGCMKVQSQQGVGSTFTVYLPIKLVEAPVTPHESTSSWNDDHETETYHDEQYDIISNEHVHVGTGHHHHTDDASDSIFKMHSTSQECIDNFSSFMNNGNNNNNNSLEESFRSLKSAASGGGGSSRGIHMAVHKSMDKEEQDNLSNSLRMPGFLFTGNATTTITTTNAAGQLSDTEFPRTTVIIPQKTRTTQEPFGNVSKNEVTTSTATETWNPDVSEERVVLGGVGVHHHHHLQSTSTISPPSTPKKPIFQISPDFDSPLSALSTSIRTCNTMDATSFIKTGSTLLTQDSDNNNSPSLPPPPLPPSSLSSSNVVAIHQQHQQPVAPSGAAVAAGSQQRRPSHRRAPSKNDSGLSISSTNSTSSNTNTRQQRDSSSSGSNGTGSSSFEYTSPPGENVVLVVDDNAMNRKFFGRMLSQLKIEQAFATNGLEAVNYMKQSRNYHVATAAANADGTDADTTSPSSLLSSYPHVGMILMDWSMPVMDGCEAIQRIRNDLGLKNVPIIAVTACALESRKEELLKSGATEFATKPFLRKDLVEKCQRYLKQQHHQPAAPAQHQRRRVSHHNKKMPATTTTTPTPTTTATKANGNNNNRNLVEKNKFNNNNTNKSFDEIEKSKDFEKDTLENDTETVVA